MNSDRKNLSWRAATLGVVVGALLLAGCGVKSSPALPEDATYPRVYPAPGGDATDDAVDSNRSLRRKPSGGDNSTVPAATDRTYVPPAPATEYLAQ